MESTIPGPLSNPGLLGALSISCDEDEKAKQKRNPNVHEVEVNLKHRPYHRIPNSSSLSSGMATGKSSSGMKTVNGSRLSHVAVSVDATIEERAHKIIQEARNACSSAERSYSNERKKQILQDALRGRTNRNARIRLRSTNEVLQLAEKVLPVPQHQQDEEQPLYERSCISPTLIDCISPVCSVEDDYEKAMEDLSSKMPPSADLDREIMLNKIDGIDRSIIKESPEDSNNKETVEDSYNPLDSFFRLIWGSDNSATKTETTVSPQRKRVSIPVPAIDNIQSPAEPLSPILSASSSVYGTSRPPSYAETITATVVDSRMPNWMQHLTSNSEDEREDDKADEPQGDFYTLGTSQTVIVHEIVRGNWTWCTAWSPDGSRLAVATENHHLAVVDTASSMVWRVRHDKRISTPMRKDTTHTIRSIAWGSQFIAVGGTGNAVSILAPTEPYPIIHTIRGTGFVGSLDWKLDSAVLAIGSRHDKCLIVNVAAMDDDGSGPPGRGRRIGSTVLHTMTRKAWVNVVAFSPGGTLLALGDQSGKLSVYNYEGKHAALPNVSNIANFAFDDAILAVEWSPDGKWLYAGGEDFNVTVVDTASWEVLRRIPRDRWVQFIASSQRGTHVAVGGVTSEVTILDANKEWAPVMHIELKGLVPLSARWHPKDQFLALTGQDNSVIAIETTDARHVKGHFLSSTSAILAVEFSPDCRMAAIGNEAGIVSFYVLSETTFITSYEMVLANGGSQSIRWSASGQFVMVGNGRSLVIIGKVDPHKMDERTPPNTSGFSVRKVIRSLQDVNSVSIDGESRYIALGGETTRILDATASFSCVREWKNGVVLANAWSPDGIWLATIGRTQQLSIYDTSSVLVDQWRVMFTLQAAEAGLALAWAPFKLDGLQYLAYGGEDKKVTIIEIRTHEGTWETVLEVSRAGVVHDLDWNNDGMLAVGVGDGTVTIIDLAYLHSGWAVNEMDYNWQRQGVTCFTEIRRNRGENAMRAVRWMPSIPGDDNFLAIGGTDGALEIVDLTERQRCRGFATRAVS